MLHPTPSDSLDPEAKTVLAYAPPVAVHAPAVEAAANGANVRVDLGPMPTAMLLQLIVPAALVMGACAGVAVMGFWHGGGRVRQVDMGITFAAVMGALAGGVWLAQIARHRGAPGVIEATGGTLLYSGPDTGGVTRALAARDIRLLKVRRDALRPWLCRLEAIPNPPAFFSLKSSRPPVLLAVHGNARELRAIAERLTVALWLRGTGRGT